MDLSSRNPIIHIPRHLRHNPADDAATLRHRLRGYRLDQALDLVRRLENSYASAWNRAALPPSLRRLWPAAINGHQITHLAKALIEAADDYRAKAFTFEEYSECANLYNNAVGIDYSPSWTLTDWQLFFLRIAYQQWRHQSQRWPNLARTLCLYDVLARRPDLNREFDIPSTFERVTGLSIQDFMAFGLWTFMLSTDPNPNQGFRQEASFVREDVAFAHAENVARFFSRVSADYRQFRELAAKCLPSDPQLQFYGFNPLESRPIIRTQRSGLVVPVPGLLFDRFTTGIYHDLLQENAQDFTSCLGHVFEAYVGELLASVYGPDQLFGEIEYGETAERSTDWIVLEGDTATLLECKVTRLTLAARVSADPELLQADLIKGIVKGLRELSRVIDDVRQRKPGLEPFHAAVELVPVVLVLDRYYTGNAHAIREMIDAELQSAGVRPFDYQIIAVEEIELVLPFIKQDGLGNLLRKKMLDTANIVNSSAFMEFDVYLRSVSVEPPDRRQPEIWSEPLRRFLTHVGQSFPELQHLDLASLFDEDDAEDDVSSGAPDQA